MFFSTNTSKKIFFGFISFLNALVSPNIPKWSPLYSSNGPNAKWSSFPAVFRESKRYPWRHKKTSSTFMLYSILSISLQRYLLTQALTFSKKKKKKKITLLFVPWLYFTLIYCLSVFYCMSFASYIVNQVNTNGIHPAVETQNAASGLLKKVVFWQHRK